MCAHVGPLGSGGIERCPCGIANPYTRNLLLMWDSARWVSNALLEDGRRTPEGAAAYRAAEQATHDAAGWDKRFQSTVGDMLPLAQAVAFAALLESQE